MAAVDGTQLPRLGNASLSRTWIDRVLRRPLRRETAAAARVPACSAEALPAGQLGAPSSGSAAARSRLTVRVRYTRPNRPAAQSIQERAEILGQLRGELH